MAAIPAVTTQIGKRQLKITWASVTENDTFAATQCGSLYTDRTVQVVGTFGSATVLIKGSHAGSTYFTLSMPAGSASFTDAGGGVLNEVTQYLQPTHSGGSSESVTVTIILTKGRG